MPQLPTPFSLRDRVIQKEGELLVIRDDALFLRREHPESPEYSYEVIDILLAENSSGETMITTISYQGSVFTVVNSWPTKTKLDLIKICRRLKTMAEDEAFDTAERLLMSQFPSWLGEEIVVK